MVRHNVRHVYPWTRRALQVLAKLEGVPYRRIAKHLHERRLVGELVDPATVRRAVLRAREGRAR